MHDDRARKQVEAGWSVGESGSVVREDRVVHVEHVWGTAISIIVTGTTTREDPALTALAECSAWFAHVDRVFSTFRADSEVSAARRGFTGPFSAEFEDVAGTCARLRDETEGVFDPWSVPGGYDPSGYVKGWGAQRALDLLGDAGFADVLVNAGGDVCARGVELPGLGAGWPVGIVSPYDRNEIVSVVRLRNAAMATSGRSERGDHVRAADGAPTGVRVDSATVVGPDLGEADALATAALLRGHGAARWIADRGDAWSLHLVAGGVAYTYGAAFAGQGDLT